MKLVRLLTKRNDERDGWGLKLDHTILAPYTFHSLSASSQVREKPGWAGSCSGVCVCVWGAVSGQAGWIC